MSIKVLVACEFSGTVRDAFNAYDAFDAWSCDLRADDNRSNRHIQGDVRDILGEGWDLLVVAHPPCTRLCNSGVRWLSEPPGKLGGDYSAADRAAYAGMSREQRLDFMWSGLRFGADLFSTLWNAPVPHIAVENPVMHKHAKAIIRNYVEPAQSVQPWQYGHGETKRTCFWLRNLPPLTPTNVVDGREARVHNMAPVPERSKERSRFFTGIAAAMADQWGHHVLAQVQGLRRAA